MIIPFLKKDDQRLPDYFGIKIYYVTGDVEEYEVASRSIRGSELEFVTKDDEWHLVNMANVKRLSYDKRFSKMVAIVQERRALDKQNDKDATKV